MNKNVLGEDSSEEEMLSDDDESVFQPYYNRLVQPRDYSTGRLAKELVCFSRNYYHVMGNQLKSLSQRSSPIESSSVTFLVFLILRICL